jgi:hypothetical protein
MKRAIVAVVPSGERDRRRRLFDALEQAFPVDFQGRAVTDLAHADAAILIAPDAEAERAAASAGVRRLVAAASEAAPAPGANGGPLPSFELAREAALDARLRGQRLGDASAGTAAPLTAVSGGTVLAALDGDPLWVTADDGTGRCDTVALAPAELEPGEALRARLQEGRSLALLPLVHLLREVTAPIDFRPPPVRATFLLDDPNLHWPSYGYVGYRELVRHAEQHDYHATMAMVPLDGWFAHPGVAKLFRAHASRLSLCCHGNDHILEELLRPRPEPTRRAMLAQALRRIDSFERSTGVGVARVMTAPHGGCSEEMTRDMLRLGFDALCIARPYPWAARPPGSWLTGPEDASELAAFGPATLVTGGLPVLLRRPFGDTDGDLALRAYLDQPLILYGHHDDLAGGLDLFAGWAERVRALGGARWASLGEIARTNFATRREGDLLRVRMYARRVTIEVPEGVERVAFEAPPGRQSDGAERVACRSGDHATFGDEISVGRGERTLDARLVREDALDHRAIRRPAWSPWPLARRLAGESRDRMVPLYRRAAATRS